MRQLVSRYSSVGILAAYAFAWRPVQRNAASAQGAEEAEPVSRELPLGKLACRARPSAQAYKPVVLVSCGSFNPPTHMHLRMFELARDHLREAGYDVLGGYLSPVNAAYGKAGLESADHRIAMAKAACSSSDFIMVDDWEASQPTYQRSLRVLERVQTSLQNAFLEDAQLDDSREPQKSGVRVMLLCGSDMVESFMRPGVWKPDHLAAILDDHGVVCIARWMNNTPKATVKCYSITSDCSSIVPDWDAASLESLAVQDDSILHHHRQGIFFVEEPVRNSISSSVLRSLLAKGKSVKYLTPDPVIQYIEKYRLYQSN